VLATSQNAVIPYAVGVDIACRMCLSVYDVEAGYVDHKKDLLKSYLLNNSHFGLDMKGYQPLPDEVFDLPEWNATKLIRSLRGKAEAQVGSSGTGNHFVEWGVLEISAARQGPQTAQGQVPGAAHAFGFPGLRGGHCQPLLQAGDGKEQAAAGGPAPGLARPGQRRRDRSTGSA
jgi:tRNA-splicing ligase RtcB